MKSSDLNNISFLRQTHDGLMLPPWVADDHSLMRDTGRQIAWELLTDIFRHGAVKVTVTTLAAIDDVSLLVTPLLGDLLKGEVIQFGPKKFARLTADAPAGDNQLDVEPLAVAIAANDVGYSAGDGGWFVPSGEEMDLLSDGRVLPSIIGTGGVTCYGLLITNANAAASDASSGYGVATQCQVYENLLPRSSGGPPKTISGTHKTELLARGGAWVFLQYSDNT